jgi:hypothetical protein
MSNKINSPEVNEILKILVKAISDAKSMNGNNNNEHITKEITKFLDKIEIKITEFFREHIDRRKKIRQQSLYQDMLAKYKIKNVGYM